jgi:phospholipase/carboxylesterase
VSRPTEPADGGTVAVLLHGRGSHRGDLQALRPALPESWGLITPQGPHPGHPWGYGPGWAWYRYVERDEIVGETLQQSMTALDAFLAELPGILGYEPGKIVMGGFSQGGTVSLAYALSRPRALAAAFNFSGFLPASVEVPFSALSPTTPPIYWGHGLRDPAIPIEIATLGRERLRAAGVPVENRDYEIGHWMVPEEIAEAVALVEAER